MVVYKDEAIILHAHDLGEADRIVSMITAGRGLRRAVAKGVKRTSSRFGARLEPFTHLRVVLHEGRNLDTVTQAEIVRSHAAVREDFEKFLFGEAMLELIEKSLQENQTIPRLFEILEVTLGILEGEVREPALLLSAFLLKTCALVGYRPRLEDCILCGREMGAERCFLDPGGGGVVCSACKGQVPTGMPLNPEALRLMRSLLGEKMAGAARREEENRLVNEVIRASFLFAESVLERRLKSRSVVLGHLERKGEAGPGESPHATTNTRELD